MSSVLEHLMTPDMVVVFDLDGVLSLFEYGENSHCPNKNMGLLEWTNYTLKNGYNAKPNRILHNFIQHKGVDNCYVCTLCYTKIVPYKRRFVTEQYGISDKHIMYVEHNKDKLGELLKLADRLGIDEKQLAIVEDTVDNLDYIKSNSDICTVHVSSFFNWKIA